MEDQHNNCTWILLPVLNELKTEPSLLEVPFQECKVKVEDSTSIDGSLQEPAGPNFFEIEKVECNLPEEEKINDVNLDSDNNYDYECDSQDVDPLQLDLQPAPSPSLNPEPEPEPSVTLKCRVINCGQAFNSSLSLDEHERIHLTDKNTIWNCPVCPATYPSKQTMEQHLVNHDSNLKSSMGAFTCSICWNVFRDCYDLRRHEMKRAKDAPVKCPSCKRSFCFLNEMKTHFKDHGDGNKLRICRERGCSRAFITPNGLTIHVRRYHSEDSRSEETPVYFQGFKCHMRKCGKIFQKKVQLKQHLRSSHRSFENPFKCTKCKTSYRYELGLQLHRQEYHSNDKQVDQVEGPPVLIPNKTGNEPQEYETDEKPLIKTPPDCEPELAHTTDPLMDFKVEDIKLTPDPNLFL